MDLLASLWFRARFGYDFLFWCRSKSGSYFKTRSGYYWRVHNRTAVRLLKRFQALSMYLHIIYKYLIYNRLGFGLRFGSGSPGSGCGSSKSGKIIQIRSDRIWIPNTVFVAKAIKLLFVSWGNNNERWAPAVIAGIQLQESVRPASQGIVHPSASGRVSPNVPNNLFNIGLGVIAWICKVLFKIKRCSVYTHKVLQIS